MKPSRSQWKKCRKCVWKTKVDTLHYFCPWPKCQEEEKPNEKQYDRSSRKLQDNV